jgi:hypothetical protein
MRVTDLKGKLKNKAFILAGRKLFLNTVHKTAVYCYFIFVRTVPAICVIHWTNLKTVV